MAWRDPLPPLPNSIFPPPSPRDPGPVLAHGLQGNQAWPAHPGEFRRANAEPLPRGPLLFGFVLLLSVVNVIKYTYHKI